MPGLLPPGYRCTAYWYARQARLLTGNGDLEFLRALGLAAWHVARERGVPEWVKVPEGPYWVLQWPEEVWSEAADRMAGSAARYGDYSAVPGLGAPPPAQCRQLPVPPASPPPYGDSFWSCPAPPEGTQAYADWCAMADAESADEDIRWPSPGMGPWDNAYEASDAAWDPGWPPMSSEDM